MLQARIEELELRITVLEQDANKTKAAATLGHNALKGQQEDDADHDMTESERKVDILEVVQALVDR